MKNDEPLFKGGCGHSAKSIEETAEAFGVILTIFLIFLIIFAICPLIFD
jgi:hypothetical protein